MLRFFFQLSHECLWSYLCSHIAWHFFFLFWLPWIWIIFNVDIRISFCWTFNKVWILCVENFCSNHASATLPCRCYGVQVLTAFCTQNVFGNLFKITLPWKSVSLFYSCFLVEGNFRAHYYCNKHSTNMSFKILSSWLDDWNLISNFIENLSWPCQCYSAQVLNLPTLSSINFCNS